MKSPADVDKEGAILSEMLDIVEQKDSLRSMLEEDRQRWAVFLNLIDLAQSSLDDDVFDDEFPVGSSSPPSPVVDDDEQWTEQEIEDLFRDDSPDLVDIETEQPTSNQMEMNKRSAKLEWSRSVEFEGQTVELRDLISHQELEMWSANNNNYDCPSPAPIGEDLDVDVEEFDQLIQDLSDDGTASLGSSNGQDGGHRAVSSSAESDCNYFYERRQMANNEIQRHPTGANLKEKVQVFDELDRQVRQRVDNKEEEQDWGSLGVKFENRGAVRDLVWMWEYNHLQQSGRNWVYPEDKPLNQRPKNKQSKVAAVPLVQDEELLFNSEQSEDVQKITEEESGGCSADELNLDGDGWPLWQIGILFWLVVFSYFILSTLPADSSLPFYSSSVFF